jgi:hypothetical protein
MSSVDESLLGVAVAKRTGERRLVTVAEYCALDESSEARWEFFGLSLDPATGEPSPAEMKEFGFTPGGPTMIPGEYVESEPGMFAKAAPADESEPAEVTGSN